MFSPILGSNERLKLHSGIPASEVAHDYNFQTFTKAGCCGLAKQLQRSNA